MVTCWTGKKDWMTARKKQNSPEDRYKLITYILNKMKPPTQHRKTEKRQMKKRDLRKRHPGIWVPKTPLCIRAKEDPQCTW